MPGFNMKKSKRGSSIRSSGPARDLNELAQCDLFGSSDSISGASWSPSVSAARGGLGGGGFFGGKF